MRFPLPSLCLPLLVLAAPALADGSIIVSPVYAQLVALPVPSDFKPGFEHEAKGAYLLELAPKDETVENWTQLITLSGGKDLAAMVTPEKMGSALAKGYQSACPDSFVAHGLPVPKVQGAGEVFAGYLGCGTVAGHSEAMVFLVLKGASDIYTVQWAERGPASDKPVEPDEAVWRPRLETLAQTRICDRVAGEQAPYPSCTQ